MTIPSDRVKEAYGRLIADRHSANYHREIGFSDLKNRGERATLARLWLDRLTTEHDLWRFSVLGLDTAKLCEAAFGTERPRTNIYRRFYRANLLSSLSAISRGHDEVHVLRCYHDEEGQLEADPWFDWHTLEVVETRYPNVTCRCRRVTFVNSDHAKEKTHQSASHFVQLADILVGATRYVVEAHGRNPGRNYAVETFAKLVERMNSSAQCRNVKSRFQHVGRASLSFFPSRALTEAELLDPVVRDTSTFFRDRPLRLLQIQSDQRALEFGDS